MSASLKNYVAQLSMDHSMYSPKAPKTVNNTLDRVYDTLSKLQGTVGSLLNRVEKLEKRITAEESVRQGLVSTLIHDVRLANDTINETIQNVTTLERRITVLDFSQPSGAEFLKIQQEEGFEPDWSILFKPINKEQIS
jgi:hypothetical protein